MAARLVRKLKHVLRSPGVILGELLALALAGVLLTLIPQSSDRLAAVRLEVEHPLAGPWVRRLALDSVARSAWFLGLVSVAAASLAIVLVEQWRRAAREWRAPLGPAAFRGAPYRREFERARAPGSGTRFETRGRVGMLGSPLFHLGLMVIVVAGLVRLLFGAEAVVDLFEGETLPPDPSAYGAQWHGALGRPFSLREAVQLIRLEPSRYGSGNLRGLAARVRVGPSQEAGLAINGPLALGWERLYLSQLHGPAALLDFHDGRQVRRLAVLLRAEGRAYEGSAALPGGVEIVLRGEVGPAGQLPGRLETRVLRGGALLFVGGLDAGGEAVLGDAGSVRLADVRYWGELVGARDYSVWIAYLGFALALLGALIMFTVIRQDVAVVVTPREDRERVLVALRVQRLAPLFAERFEALVRSEGGPAGNGG